MQQGEGVALSFALLVSFAACGNRTEPPEPRKQPMIVDGIGPVYGPLPTRPGEPGIRPMPYWLDHPEALLSDLATRSTDELLRRFADDTREIQDAAIIGQLASRPNAIAAVRRAWTSGRLRGRRLSLLLPRLNGPGNIELALDVCGSTDVTEQTAGLVALQRWSRVAAPPRLSSRQRQTLRARTHMSDAWLANIAAEVLARALGSEDEIYTIVQLLLRQIDSLDAPEGPGHDETGYDGGASLHYILRNIARLGDNVVPVLRAEVAEPASEKHETWLTVALAYAGDPSVASDVLDRIEAEISPACVSVMLNGYIQAVRGEAEDILARTVDSGLLGPDGQRRVWTLEYDAQWIRSGQRWPPEPPNRPRP
jgi:hypothetical protein